MKNIFRKAMTIAGSAALIGMTVGTAMAASYPAPFTSNTAIVVGANAAPSDSIAASSIASNLDALAVASVTTLSGATGETEDEVTLGGVIKTGKLSADLTDSKVSSLLDAKINWDDGGASGADDYNIHEEILLASMAIKTTLDDNDFEGLLAMTNDKEFEYRYVFDDAFNVSGVGATGADDLYLTILGKEYEISAMTADSVTVVTSGENSLAVGNSVTVEGKTFTLDDLSSTAAKVNGETIADGSSKKIDGLQVEVKSGSIFYNDNFPEQATVTLKIGTDISKTYSDGEEYIGEDEDDPTWVWHLDNLDTAAGYIGVKYNQGVTEYDDEGIIYEGGSYMFPENFGEVKFESTTAGITYEDFEIYFDDSEDLWNNSDLTSTEQTSNAPVLIIESVDGVQDSIVTAADVDGNTHETNKIYLRWAPTTEDTQGATVTNGSLEVFYSDVDGTVQDAVKPRYSTQYNSTVAADAAIASAQIAELKVGDTIVNVNISITAGDLQVALTDEGAGQPIYLDIGGVNLNDTTGELKWFGSDVETTSKETAEVADMIVSSTNVGTYDNDIMTTNGLIIETPEAHLDNDKVMLSVPSDRVYATVSVVAGGEAATPTEVDVMTVTDAQVATVAGKNLIVVGGSAINSVAAELLGGAFREAAFTEATGVAAGEALIQSFDRSGKTALLVAGYNAADTEKAVTYLLNNDVDTTVGTKLEVISATEATVVTA